SNAAMSTSNVQHCEEDLDAYLPALPPDLLAERQRKKAAKLEQNVDSQLLPKDFEKNKDDLILQQTIQEFEERAEKMRQTLEPDDKADKPLQRGEWMLVPPESTFLGETPTNMRSRQFKRRTHDPEKNDNSLWTETPADRQIRLQKEITDIEKAETIQAYNELHRPKSLLETHSESYTKSRRWKDDDVSKRPFDREKDVLGSRRMDSRKRKEFIDNAKELSSKFGHGKGGVFL
ncbi:5317_t:CDS:2, partial [Racocetra persica]